MCEGFAMRRVGFAVLLLVACGGTSPRRSGEPTTRPPVEQMLLDTGYRVVFPWAERVLNREGSRTDEVEVRAGSCLAVLVPDPDVVIEAGGVRNLHSRDMAWLVGCSEADGPVAVTLLGHPREVVVVGMFVGPREAQAHVRLAEHFQLPTSSAQDQASTLAVQATCGEDEAREHYRRGMELARAESFDDAADALALAYACLADGTILFNLATVTARRGRENAAREMFLQLLRDHPQLPSELRVEVERALDRLLRVGTMRIRVERDDSLYINGVRIAFEGTRAEVEAVPGRHEVILRNPAGQRHEIRVQLRSDQTLEIDPRISVSGDE